MHFRGDSCFPISFTPIVIKLLKFSLQFQSVPFSSVFKIKYSTSLLIIVSISHCDCACCIILKEWALRSISRESGDEKEATELRKSNRKVTYICLCVSLWSGELQATSPWITHTAVSRGHNTGITWQKTVCMKLLLHTDFYNPFHRNSAAM